MVKLISLSILFVIVSSPSVFAQSLKLPAITLIVAQAADLYSTHVALTAGAREANLLMDSTNASRIAVKVGVTAGALLITKKLAHRHPVLAHVALYTASAGTLYVASRNYRIAQMMR